jgi:nucleoside-diphosphate-sugar epimerase
MSRVLVTGAAGFIGSHLVRGLSLAGYSVRGAVRSLSHTVALPADVELVEGDLRTSDFRRAADSCEVVVHLAGKAHTLRPGRDDEQAHLEANVEGTRNVLDGAAAAGAKRVIFASTVKVFGESAAVRVDESVAPRPETPYGRSKWLAEQLMVEYAAKFGLDVVSLRLPLVYGPTEKGNLFRMLAAIDRGWFPPLSRIQNRRSMLHVDNLVQAICVLLDSAAFPRPCYIVADAEPYSVSRIYEALRQGLGQSRSRWAAPVWALKLAARCGDIIQAGTRAPMPFNSAVLEKLAGSAWYSAEALARDFAYRPTLRFEDAVPGLIAAYRSANR